MPPVYSHIDFAAPRHIARSSVFLTIASVLSVVHPDSQGPNVAMACLVAWSLLLASSALSECATKSLRRAGVIGLGTTWVWFLGRAGSLVPMPAGAQWAIWACELGLGIFGVAVAAAISRGSLAGRIPLRPGVWMLAGLCWGIVHLLVPLAGTASAWLRTTDQQWKPQGVWAGVFLAGLLSPAVFMAWAGLVARRFGRSAPDRCVVCGYSTAGTPGEMCPECGQRASVEVERTPDTGFQVRWHCVGMMIAGILAWVQLPLSGFQTYLPTSHLLWYAGQVDERPVLRWEDQGVAFRLQGNGLEAPTRSFSEQAVAAQAEILRRAKTHELGSWVDTVANAGVLWIAQRRVASTGWERILSLLNDSGVLAPAQSQALFDSLTEYRVETRDRLVPGGPLALEISVQPREFSGDSGARLPDMRTLVCDLELVAEEITVSEKVVGREVSLSQWHARSFGGAQFRWRPSNDLPMVPPDQESGPVVVRVRLRCQLSAHANFEKRVTPEAMQSWGLAHPWHAKATRAAVVVPPGVDPFVRTRDSAAAEFFASSLVAHLDVSERQPSVWIRARNSFLREQCSSNFAFDVYAFAGAYSEPIGSMTFDSRLWCTANDIHIDPVLAARLTSMPPNLRCCLFVPNPVVALRTPRDGPLYEGPSIRIPVMLEKEEE